MDEKDFIKIAASAITAIMLARAIDEEREFDEKDAVQTVDAAEKVANELIERNYFSKKGRH